MRLGSWLLVLACTIMVLATGAPAASAQGRMAVTLTAPAGVPASVVVRGPATRIAAKPPKGKLARRTFALAPGRYSVQARPVLFRGRVYAPGRAAFRVRVANGKTVRVSVHYQAVPSASDLRPTRIGPSAISLTWKGPKGAVYELRRAAGARAPAARTQGVRVRTAGRTAADTGVRPGRQYSYALFTRVRGRWSGPISVSASTAPAPGSSSAAFVTAPGTVIATAPQIAFARTTGSGVAVRLQSGSAPPVVGTIVVLPQTPSLPGGFLGRVASVAADGTATLVAVSLDEAFDYYELDVAPFDDEPTPLEPAATPPSSGQRALRDDACKTDVSGQITLTTSIGLAGKFKVKIDKHKVRFGPDAPKGVSLDMELVAKARTALGAKVQGSRACKLPFKPVMKTLATSPVPISVLIEPTAKVSANGTIAVADLGAEAKAGFSFRGRFGVDGVEMDGSPIYSAAPLERKGTIDGMIELTLAGELTVGPGAGTTKAGAIAGVSGRLAPLEASFGSSLPVGDPRRGACLQAEAAFARELALTAKAWVGGWKAKRKVEFDFLKGKTPYPGTPWHWPSTCPDLPPPPQPPAPPETPEPKEPGDSVVGDGVSVISDTTTGATEQVGYVDGLVPGSKAWVLSTGRIADAIGSPDAFASTDLGLPGDDDLSTLAGYETRDAAAYEMRLVPTGDRLHVKYVFASEEYPDFVGSAFNDVMQVQVNGVNCAHVPGTTDPVSVNTVNALTNADYYVDNRAGAAGYSTSMNGLTVPLTCTVPVTPGQEVTVKIAVADSSDGIYDSAVALVDNGIWSD